MGLDITGIGSIADLLNTVVGKIWPDPEKQAEAKAAIIQAQQAGSFKQMDQDFQLSIEQIKTNAVSASQPGMHFRDGAGWICVVALAMNFVLRPLLSWGSAMFGYVVTLPALDDSQLTPMLIGLLGLGGMHVYQQVKNA